jgi:hypothetical protein
MDLATLIDCGSERMTAARFAAQVRSMQRPSTQLQERDPEVTPRLNQPAALQLPADLAALVDPDLGIDAELFLEISEPSKPKSATSAVGAKIVRHDALEVQGRETDLAVVSRREPSSNSVDEMYLWKPGRIPWSDNVKPCPVCAGTRFWRQRATEDFVCLACFTPPMAGVLYEMVDVAGTFPALDVARLTRVLGEERVFRILHRPPRERGEKESHRRSWGGLVGSA